MLMFVLPLFRVIVEPLSMAATLIWFIGVSFVELKFLPTLPPLVPASCEVPPHQWQELYWSHLPGLRSRSSNYAVLGSLSEYFPVRWLAV